jgi:hypothetical protein
MTRRTFAGLTPCIRTLVASTLIAVTVTLSGCGMEELPADLACPSREPCFPGSVTQPEPEPVGTGTADLSWEPPLERTDGSPITDLTGYKVYVGRQPGSYTRVIDVGDVTTYTVGALPPGLTYFAASAYDATGQESPISDDVSKVVP